MRLGAAPTGIAIDGMPLRLGVAEDHAGEGWHMVTGARGRYPVELDHGFDMIARGSASRTTFIDTPEQDRAAATAAAEFRARRGAWRFGLTPGLAATRWQDGAMHRDGTMDGRISRPISSTLGFTASGRYRWRVADGVEAFHSEAFGGRVGLTCRLPSGRFELAYAARHETWSAVSGYGGPDATFAHGPSFSVDLPLDRSLDLKAGYSFTETRSRGLSDAEAAMQAAGGTDRLHQLNLGVTWDVGGDSSDLALSFRYRFERMLPETGADETHHAGTVNLALGF
ncbi:hypothetical protein [Desertibaculum subflavum]|uniref:hypothetical protein n=1 Tax=Desertibaculum subflavum TaxID=2268458 RepID=UPI0013C451AD